MLEGIGEGYCLVRVEDRVVGVVDCVADGGVVFVEWVGCVCVVDFDVFDG